MSTSAMFIFLLILLSCPAFLFAAYFEPMPLGLASQSYFFEGQKGASWGDFDNDGLLDILVTSAATSAYQGYAKILRNNGTGFEDLNNNNIPQVPGQLAQWGDFDNDGDLDILLGGNWEGSCTHGTPTVVLRNDQNGVWTQVAELQALCFAAGEWGDFDNDGYLDLGITGGLNFSKYIIFDRPRPFTMLYRNEKGTGKFTPLVGALPHAANSDLNFGDFDNDGWLDVALLGLNDSTTFDSPNGYFLQVFRNTNKGTSFEAMPFGTFPPRELGTCTWADFNLDGWLDILATGYSDTNANNTAAVYINNEGRGFTQQVLRSVTPGGTSTGEWGDYDNDGYPDFCYFGYNYADGGFVGGIFKNYGGSGHFNLTETLNDETGQGAACVWGDYNNDGRLDAFLIGYNIDNGGVYTNTGATPSQPPSPPTSVTYNCSNSQLIVTWERPADTQGALTYNVAIQNDTLHSLVASMALPDGTRLVPRMGNAQARTFFILDDVADCSIENFQVSVQTIDASFRGSTFATSTTTPSSSSSSFLSSFLFTSMK